MSARDTGETPIFPSGPPADPPPARPSWDTGARPAAPLIPPRAAPPPAATEAPPKPYYAAAPPPLVPPPTPDVPPPSASAYQAEDVKYDLAGNPIASKSTAPVPTYAPQVQAGYPAGAATSGAATSGAATSWPPAAGGPAYGGGPRNTSGEGGEVPPEVARLSWNWGAFFFPVMWCRKHGLTAEANILRYSFLAIVVLRIATHGSVPTAFLILGIIYGVAYSGARTYFALKGHQMGWRSRHFPGGLQDYFQVQKAWMWWGFGLSAVWAFALPVLVFLGVLGAVLSTQHNSGYPNRYGGSSGYGGYNRPVSPEPASGSGPAAPSQGSN